MNALRVKMRIFVENTAWMAKCTTWRSSSADDDHGGGKSAHDVRELFLLCNLS